ncbi:MAG TPA: response regulator transcription factor [Actinomycetes bacterium]|jgi:DNA-binding NarL/FixJ family response regulator|nr:response regulator transcription factor [Actinomycetes bacterium]
MTSPIRVVIAEDHYLFREGTRQLLETSGRIEVVATVGDAATLHDAVQRLRPDAAVVDIRMPPDHETEGIAAALRIRAEHPEVGVVVLSQYANALYAFELFRNGTQGLAYLLKDRVGDVDELVGAVTAVSEGGSVIDPNVVESLVYRKTKMSRGSLGALTERETEVLAEMAQGRSNAAISESLFISESAVEKHINSILMKLGLDPGDSSLNRRVTAVLAFLHSYQPIDQGG